MEDKCILLPVDFRKGELAAEFLTAMQLTPIEALENPPMSGSNT